MPEKWQSRKHNMQNIAHNFTSANSTTPTLTPSTKTYRIIIHGKVDNIAIGRITDVQYNYWKKFGYDTTRKASLKAIINGYQKDYSVIHGGYGYCYEDCNSDVNTIDVNCSNKFEINGVTHYGHIYVPDKYNFMINKYRWQSMCDIDGVFGAHFDNYGSIVYVIDENNQLIFRSELNRSDLNKHGIQYTLGNAIDVDGHPDVSHYTVIVDHEYGIYFDNDFTLTSPFDSSKLSFFYTTYENDEYIDKVFYDGIEIPFFRNDSYSDFEPKVRFYKN